VGVAVCFLANGASFLAVLAALALMRPDELHPSPPAGHERGQLRAGFHRAGLALGALACLLAAALGGAAVARTPPGERRHPRSVPMDWSAYQQPEAP